MTDERNASDVLLDIERRIINIEKRQKNIDINVKSILNKLNLMSAKPLSISSRSQKPVPSALPDGPIAKPPIPTKEDLVFKNADSLPVEQRKSIVEQRIAYKDGRPVILANVTVCEADLPTNILAKVHTDAHGKWYTQLFGGKYKIEVIKGPTAAQRGFKIEYEIEVPGNGKPLTLERKQVE